MNTFDKYGKNFQVKLITILLKDKHFLAQIYDILFDKYFDSNSAKFYVNVIKEYYEKYKKPPTNDVVKHAISNIHDESLKISCIQDYNKIKEFINIEDMEYVKDEALSFTKNQEMKSAILESVDLLQIASYDSIYERVSKAMSAGQEINYGLEYNEDSDSRYDDENEELIPTPYPVFNNIMNGGLAKGSLGIILGAQGSGKTWGLVGMGVHALKLGYNVAHYSLELKENYVGKRYDSMFSGVSFNQLKYHKDDVISKVKEKNKGRLIIKNFPTRVATVNTLRAHLQKLEFINFKPDMIIVDYGDLLTIKAERGRESSFHTSGDIYADLRGLAGEFDSVLWTASQTNREGLTAEVIEGNLIDKSIEKLAIADFLFSASRKTEDKLNGTARYLIIKNRMGRDGILCPAKVNTDNGFIEVFEPVSSVANQVNKDMKNNDKAAKKYLAEKARELNIFD